MERYAILLGIDDQFPEGLTKCSKDVEDLALILENYCLFKPKNIFRITSKYGQENKLAHNELETRIEFLKNEPSFGSNDILLIYFSGHGKYDTASQTSCLEFPDFSLTTEKIKEYIDVLHPKHSIIIFDACFIGAKILSKSFNLNKLKRKLHVDSEGVFGIYASPIERAAYLPDELGNSLLTYHFIQTIKDEKSYDEDGLLSIDNLASICSKKVYRHSAELVKSKKISKEQIVVREGRIEGWLPFAEREIHASNSKTKKQDGDTVSSSKVTSSEPDSSVSANNLKAEKEKFNLLLTSAKKELKGFSPVISAMILSYYSDKPYQPRYEYYQTEINEAVRKGILDDEGGVNYSNRSVSSLLKAIENLTTFITDRKRTYEFDEFFDKEYEVSPNDSDNQIFWENVFGIDVPFE